MSLRKRAASATTWTIFSQALSVGNHLVSTVILARLLPPADFGVFAIAAIFTGFAQLLGGMGIGGAVLRWPQLERRHELSAFWLQVVFGTALSGAIVLLAPLVAWFFGEPRATPILRAVSPLFLLQALAIVPQRLDQRELRTRRLAIVEIVSEIGATVLAVIAALRGMGPFALVIRTLAAAGLQAVLIWIATGWRPALLFDGGAAKELLGFSSGLTMTMLLNYATRRVGDLLVGKLSGTRELGFYNRAYAITVQPFFQVNVLVMRVLVPLLTKVRSDERRLREVFTRATAAIALAVLPLSIGLVTVAEPFVLTVFGNDWVGMIPILRFFALALLPNVIESASLQLFLLQGESFSLFRWRMVTSGLTVLACVSGAAAGGAGIAAALAVRSWGLLYFSLAAPGRLVGIDARPVLLAMAPIGGCSLVMGGVVWFADQWMQSNEVPAGLRLLAGSLTGCLVYFLILHVSKVTAWTDVRTLFREQLARRPARPSPPG